MIQKVGSANAPESLPKINFFSHTLYISSPESNGIDKSTEISRKPVWVPSERNYHNTSIFFSYH